MKHFMKVLAIAIVLAALPALSLAQDISDFATVDTQATFTLADMLTLAMQDEYLAQAEYLAIQQAFGEDNPFANIMEAEAAHQEALLKLFETYGITLPENTAADYVVIPETLQETYEAGIQAEIKNIAMYEAFLAQGDLPLDAVNTFTALMHASQSHLEAFTHSAERDGIRLNLSENNQYSQGNSNGNTNMYGEPAQYQETTQTREATQTGEATQIQHNQQDRNGNGNGNGKGNGGN